MPIFSNKRYAFLWCGHLVSTIGDYLLYAALPFLIYDRTGSAMAGAGIFISILLPPVLFGSIAGVLADRWDRRRIMIAADALRALILLSLLVHPRYWWVAHIVAFLESLFSQLFSPARNALLPSLVKPDHLVEANSFSALAENIGRLSGPALGGVLLATTGAEGVIFADSMSYMISAVFIGMIPAVPYTKPERNFSIFLAKQWKEGFFFLKQDKVLQKIAVSVAIAMIGDGVFSAVVAPFVKDVLHKSAMEFGSLLTIRGLGGITGTILVSSLSKKLLPAGLLSYGMMGTAFLLASIIYSGSFIPAMILLFFAGITAIGWIVGYQTLVQMKSQP